MALMLDYIYEQPAVLRAIAKNAGRITADFVAAFRDKPVRNVIAIGSGSSFNAPCATPRVFGDWLNATFLAVPPTRCLRHIATYSPEDTIVLFISQSGTSTSTNAYVDVMKEKGFTTVCVCEDPTSYLAKRVDVNVVLEVGPEHWGPKTKGFTGTVFTMSVMALELARAKGLKSDEECAEIYATFEKAFANMKDNIDASVEWAKLHNDEFDVANNFQLLAEGGHYHSIQEGALKMLETLYVPVAFFEFEEFLHGVNASINADSNVLIVIGNDERRARLGMVQEVVASRGGRTFPIVCDEPMGFAGELVIKTSGDDLTALYESLIPMQVLSTIVPEATQRRAKRGDGFAPWRSFASHGDVPQAIKA